jgi:hypothetical protein
MPNPWDDRYRIRNLQTIAGLQPGDKLDVTGTNEFKRQRRGAWTSIARTFSHNKSSAYYAPIYKVFQETIISGFICSNGTGAGIDWKLIERSLSGLRNLGRTYENDRGKHDRLKLLVRHVEILSGLQPTDGLPVHILSRDRSCLRVEPIFYEAAKFLRLADFKPVEKMGFSVHELFVKDVVNGRWRIKMEGKTVPVGDDCIGFLAKKLGDDRSALRDLSRAANQDCFGDIGKNICCNSTVSNSDACLPRPMFAAPNGFGILPGVGGDTGNWEMLLDFRCRKRGNVVDELEFTFTNRWQSNIIMYWDFKARTNLPRFAPALTKRSPLQRIDLDIRASLVRVGENFHPVLHSALFTVYTRPLARHDDGTPEWMLASEE